MTLATLQMRPKGKTNETENNPTKPSVLASVRLPMQLEISHCYIETKLQCFSRFIFCPITQKNGKYSAAEKRMETKGPSWRRAKFSLYLIKHRIRYCTNCGAANREPHSARPGESCQASRNLSMCTRRRHDSLLIHTTIRVARLALPEH